MQKSLIIGNSHIVLHKTASTNQYLSEWARKKVIAEGTVVRAINQTQGRGQKGTQWYSTPDESLTFSLYLIPDFLPIDQQFFLNMAICNGIISCFKQFFDQPQIKWPNDIFLNKKKCGGILIENSISHGCISSSVVGIGINLNQKAFPNDLPFATSLFMQTQLHFSPDDFLLNLCQHLDIEYRQLREGKMEQIQKCYLGHLFGMNNEQRFRNESGEFIGIIKGITQAGLLVVQNGYTEKQYALKEIQFVF